ncbi:MAG: chemotaxis protein CheW [Nocardioidaceae bacterium]|nr:chemotaxis protein CheW [Nocardioidaceae bacterium]
MADQFCTFLLDGHLFGIPVQDVQEVLRHQEIRPVPLAVPEIRGLLNLRGQIVTTIDLRTRLGLPATEESAVNVIVRTPDGPVSLLVDRIGDVLEPAESTFEPAPDTVPRHLRELVKRVCKLADGLMLVLDTELAVDVEDAA